MVQVHVPARAWGFDSPPGHQPPLETLERGLVFSRGQGREAPDPRGQSAVTVTPSPKPQQMRLDPPSRSSSSETVSPRARSSKALPLIMTS